MAETVFLHVGPPKSGTSYIQAVLAANKDRLAENGLLFPGRRWRDQVHAVEHVKSLTADSETPTTGPWPKLVREINAWPQSAVITMEWLAGVDPEQARRIAGTWDVPVHVILTVRDLGRTIPAAWQEFLQNGETWSWDEFMRSVVSSSPNESRAGRLFWRQQDLGRILASWRDAVPAERVHVVTVPRTGQPPGELWTRFARATGVAGVLVDASGGGNESLGLESTELMLAVNRVSREEGLEPLVYQEMLKYALAKRGLSKRRHRESRNRSMPAEFAEWLELRSAEQIRAITSAGATVVGDLAELEPQPVFDDPPAPTDAAMLAAAVDGIVALAADRGRELARLRELVAQLRKDPATPVDDLAYDLDTSGDRYIPAPDRAPAQGQPQRQRVSATRPLEPVRLPASVRAKSLARRQAGRVVAAARRLMAR